VSVAPALSRIATNAPRPTVLAGALVFLLALGSAGCLAPPGGEPGETLQPTDTQDAMPAPARPLAAVLADHTPELMAMPGVVGTAESQTKDGRPCILVMLSKSTPELRAKLPRQLEGWPVVVEVTGEFHALPDSSR
jgi:hypothetical protein